ncbi:MAG: AmmeMemoRadiSam system radical SAM enzyme [Halanaerobiaceae bacterium]
MYENIKKAEYYKKIAGTENVQCFLCPQECKITPQNTGLCRARKNIDGHLYCENYAKISSSGLDPIEKKPLYHFFPGEEILSLGTYGCNFSCGFCQNWRISQEIPGELKKLTPHEAVEMACRKGVSGIAYTYSEPLVWFEYVRDVSRLAEKRKLNNVLVTNGFINPEPLEELLPFIAAANVDLKSFRDEFYRQQCGGSLEPVLKSIQKMYEAGIHLELTTLLIPGLNDNREELRELFSWIKDLDPDIPLHLSRYFPRYQSEISSTSPEKIREAFKLAGKYLSYVYPGNIEIGEGSNTCCPDCGTTVIIRRGYRTENRLDGGNCPDCGREIIASENIP